MSRQFHRGIGALGRGALVGFAAALMVSSSVGGPLSPLGTGLVHARAGGGPVGTSSPTVSSGPAPASSPPYVCAFPLKTVIFNETGLVNGTVWAGNLSGTSHNTSGSWMEFCESTGIYAWCVTLGPGSCAPNPPTCTAGIPYAYTCGGTISVTGVFTYLNLTFALRVSPCQLASPALGSGGYYEVNLSNEGLPYGTTWWVNISGMPAFEAGWNSTTAATTCLELQNGTYSYTAGTQNGHWVGNGGKFLVRGPATRPARIVCGEPVGSVAVKEPVVTVPVTFVILTDTVTFTQSGLPSGALWWLNITGGQISGTMSLDSTGTTITAVLVNNYTYTYTAASFSRDYDWPHISLTQGVDAPSVSVAVTFQAVVYKVTFDESGLPTGTEWYVNISGEPPQSSPAGASIVLDLTNGSYGYTASANATYRASPNSGSPDFTVNGGVVVVDITYIYVGQLPFNPPIESEYVGPFVDDGVTDFDNTFGVYAIDPGYGYAVSTVTGSIDGAPVPFTDTGRNGLWTTSVNVGNLPTDAVLTVRVNYSSGAYASSSLAIGVIGPPGWLVSLFHWAGGGSLSPTPSAPWNNSYSLKLQGGFNLSSSFDVGIPLPQYAGGGAFGFLPSMELALTVSSGGNLNLYAQFSVASPQIDAGVATVSVAASVTAQGSFQIADGTVVWQSATLTLALSGSVSVNIPIYGYTFNVPDYGPVTIGLSATVTVSPSVAATLVLLPSTSPSQDILPGLAVMLSSITATVGAEITVALNAGVGALSISGGGGVGITMYLQQVQPYIEGGKITGKVFIDYSVLWWSGTLWSDTGTLYTWGTDPPAPPAGPEGSVTAPQASANNSTTLSYIPRYYATVDYDRNVWVNGTPNGTAIQDVYPFTDLAAAGGGSDALLLYTTDNVSTPENQGLSLAGFAFNATTNSLSPVNLSLPDSLNEVVFDPGAVELPNGSYAVVWNAVPFANTSVVSPFNLTSSVVQLAYYHPATSTWSAPIDLPASPGYSQSSAIDSDPAGLYVLDQVGTGILSNDSQLEELSPGLGLIANLSVENVSRIVSFRAASQLAIVEYDNGTFGLFNLTTGSPVDATAGLACPVAEQSFVQGSENQVVSLLTGLPSDTLVLYTGSGPSIVVPLPRNVSSLKAIDYEGRVVATAAGPFGVRVYLIVGSSVQTLDAVPWQNVNQLAVALSGSHLVVFGTESYGNYTDLDTQETFTYENLSIADFSLGTSATFTETGLPPGTQWWLNLTGRAPLNSTGTTISTLLTNGPYTYTVSSTLRGYVAPGGSVTANGANVSKTVPFGPVTFPVTFAETGLPSGTEWSVVVNRSGVASQSSTGTTLTVSLPNGTYAFGVTSADSHHTATGGSFTVNGSAVTVAVPFSSTGAAPFLGLPLWASYGLLGSLTGALAASVAVLVRFKLRRKSATAPPREYPPPGGPPPAP